MTNVVYLHGNPASVAHFLQIGASGHRRLEQLLAAGQLPYARFVGEAGVFLRQKDLVDALRQAGHELVLDTNVAELSVIGRFQGRVKGAPWADPHSVLTEAHLRVGANEFDLIGQIARFAVENGISRVMAPAHYLIQATDSWFGVDLAACDALRRALDQEGGADVAIDYPLIVSNAALNDTAQRRAFVASLAGRPIDSVWLRISGFGGGVTAAALRKYIAAARDFHEPERPINLRLRGGIVRSGDPFVRCGERHRPWVWREGALRCVGLAQATAPTRSGQKAGRQCLCGTASRCRSAIEAVAGSELSSRPRVVAASWPATIGGAVRGVSMIPLQTRMATISVNGPGNGMRSLGFRSCAEFNTFSIAPWPTRIGQHVRWRS